jgi:GH25 family lysozyme M1 (1,4-beta-N-acetylmuramidase)
MEQTGIFAGRTRVRYGYSCYGKTRGNGTVWHYGSDEEGLDSNVILMPPYYNSDGTKKSISGTVVTARIVTDHSNLTWEWGYYVCVKLDANQTPDAVNYLYFCHCKQLLVKVGDKVKTGNQLAIMGNTGNAALANPPFAHCHFEVRATATSSGLDPTAYTGHVNQAGTYGSSTALDNQKDVKAKGIDASKYQGAIDWRQVKDSGIDFAILRVGSWNDDGPYVDPTFEEKYKNATAEGIKVGAYFYTYAENEDEQNRELELFLNALSGKAFEYPVFVDVEAKCLTALDKTTVSNLIKREMDILDQKGYTPGWYSYTNYINSYIDRTILKDYPLWIADYRGYVGYTGDYVMWQYASDGTVPGISEDVDMDYDYHGYGEKEPEPVPEKLQTITISMVTQNEADQICALCKKLGLTDKGLYTSKWV